MTRRVFQTIVLALLITSTAIAQTVTDPFPNPILERFGNSQRFPTSTAWLRVS